MADYNSLDALQTFHRDLLALREGRDETADILDTEELVTVFLKELEKIWRRPRRGVDAIKNDKIEVDDEEYTLNEEFKAAILGLADEVDLDLVEAARCLLDAQAEISLLGRPLLECGIIRYHQQRKYVLDSLRLLLELDGQSEESSDVLDTVKQFVDTKIFQAPPLIRSSTKGIPGLCVESMQYVRELLKKVGDRITAASVLGEARLGELSSQMQTIEYARISLHQQHELLGIILCRAIEKRQPRVSEFKTFLELLRSAERYDALLVHLLPSLGAYISAFGFRGLYEHFSEAQDVHEVVFPPTEAPIWPLVYVQAALRTWWLAEYAGYFLEGDPPAIAAKPGYNPAEEEKKRNKQFLDSLKDGAFDFLLALSADVKYQEWQDPARMGMRQWLQRNSPPLASDWIQFSDFFQNCLMSQLEGFVDSLVGNLPDVLRKLRVDEDEQRQLSQNHEHDLDLERFLVIIAYTYEGRPDAARAFWSDPDSNLAGFMHWASRRASTPLVTAFCEMLQAISEDEDCANSAHEFLMDEGHHSSGKMRRSQSLTWSQICRELVFFSNKIREKPSPSQTIHKIGKPSSDQGEAEPESAMMLECYLRLMTKLATESEAARQFLWKDMPANIVEILFQLASSPIPARLRACVFITIRALLSRKSHEDSCLMWYTLDSWMTGGYAPTTSAHHRLPSLPSSAVMDRIFEEIGSGSEEPLAFVSLLTMLVLPSENSSVLHDALPFPENIGQSVRVSGIEPYVDYVLGHVYGTKSQDTVEVNQLRMLRLSCLDFALTCLTTFNEDLILLANRTNIQLDAVISATDLTTYARLHPFARVMEWIFNDKVMEVIFATVHQEGSELGNASPDSPLLMSILRGVQVISKAMDLQSTYLELVRPMIKLQPNTRRFPVANAAYACLEDGLVAHLGLVVDLGVYCGLGHADLTLACLELLQKLSSSPRISSVWTSSPGTQATRNRAIVALEANGEHVPIARSLVNELRAPVTPGNEGETPNHLIKTCILDFLFSCLRVSPRKPTIAHLLLGFKCGIDSLEVEADGAFDSRISLFHTLMGLFVETPMQDDSGVRRWMVSLRSKAILIMQILWSSPLSSSLVIEELRSQDFLFHILTGELVIHPELRWEGQVVLDPEFPLSDGALTLVDFLKSRASSVDYIAMELCSISQKRLPTVKRRIFEALNGQITTYEGEQFAAPTVFDFFDFVLPGDPWEPSFPNLAVYDGLDLDVCRETDHQGTPIYNAERVGEILELRRRELQGSKAVATAQDLAVVEREEALLVEFLVASNNKALISTEILKVLQSWCRLLLVMAESNDFKGTARASFYIQALQAILPSLELYASDRPVESIELARLACTLMFKLDLTTAASVDADSQAVGSLVPERLYQLFQICLAAIGKWAGGSELREIYYSICFRYLTGIAAEGPSSPAKYKALNAVHSYGERLLNVLCDDACGAEVSCQTAALILLKELVSICSREEYANITDSINKLNFIGVLVDSLRNMLEEWMDVINKGNAEQQHYHNAKLALLLQLAQTREGAQHIINAGLFRTLQASALFHADPELEASPTRPKALLQLYGLLARVAQIVSAAIVSRGSHNITQGRRFLRDHRSLVSHTLKRSVGIGPAAGEELEEKIGDLADAFIVMITATDFLTSEEIEVAEAQKRTTVFFH